MPLISETLDGLGDLSKSSCAMACIAESIRRRGIDTWSVVKTTATTTIVRVITRLTTINRQSALAKEGVSITITAQSKQGLLREVIAVKTERFKIFLSG